MRNIGTVKLLIIIFVLNILESFIAPHLINFYISLPITFLVFSLAIYNSNRNSNPLFAFLCGFYLDLISSSPFGLNAGLFTMMSYVINSYANRAVESEFAKEKGYNLSKVKSFIKRKMEKGDWYMNAEEAVYYGFADRILT